MNVDLKDRILLLVAERLRVTMDELKETFGEEASGEVEKVLKEHERDGLIMHRRDEIVNRDFYLATSRGMKMASEQGGKMAF